MAEPKICGVQYPKELASIAKKADPRDILLANYKELLIERVIIDPQGREIKGRLTKLIQEATKEAQDNRCEGEPLARAIVRCALKKLNFNYNKTTLGGLPQGPAYERPMPDQVGPDQFGHEKVPYPMSDYPGLSYLPVGGLGTPMCEVDYTTCYFKAGHMVQDKAIRIMSVEINGQAYDLSTTPGTYHALYPISERSYDLPIPFSVVQFSPIIPGNYNVSSLPVEIVEVVAENITDQPMTITFTISQENILGWYPQKGEEVEGNPHGNLVWNRQNEGNIAEPIQEGSQVGVLFEKQGDEKAQKDFVRVGAGIAGQIAILSNSIPGQIAIQPVIGQDQNSAGLRMTITLKPGEKINHPIIVAYDDPFYNFQYDPTKPESPGVRMPKYYTRIYGQDGQNAKKIASDALVRYQAWKEKAIEFQRTITADPDLPDFFKQALLNELYVLTETGIWEADQGRLAYLESIDYKMYNTSDVNSYTWALLILFPELEKKDIMELGNLVPLTDPRRRWFGTDRWANIPPAQWKHLYWDMVKQPGAVCHDLGGLLGEGVFPFTNSCNEFNWSNANMWIDLAPKLALRAWRYYTFMKEQTGKEDIEFIRTIYPAIKMALDTLERRWSEKGTHMPISKGIPDTTYDTVVGHGYSPNIATQWLGALEAAAAMAQLVGDQETFDKYKTWYYAGLPAMDKLWNPKGYFNAFVSPDGSTVNENVHSDMLFGEFYLHMIGLNQLVSPERASQALETIYQVNGLAWSDVGEHGPLGLVNLRGPEGQAHGTEQGDEGWTGAMLLNAAYQIKLGMETGNEKLVQNGWNILHGFFNVVYSQSPDSQHWFGRTPEGYANPDDVRYDDKSKKYGNETGRAPKYMRALAIWAVYAALKGNKMPFNIYDEVIPEPEDTFPQPFNGQE